MQVIAVIKDEAIIYQILAHLYWLSAGGGPRAPSHSACSNSVSSPSAGPRELLDEPCYDDLPWSDPV